MANEVAKLIFKADTSDIEKAIKRLGYLKGAANDAEKEVSELGKDAKKASDGVDKLGDEAKQSTKQVGNLGKAAGSAKGKILGFAAGIASVATGMAFASKFVEVNKQFAIMNAQLLTATGSASAAAEEFERLKKFAATTPFDLAQSVDGFVKLKNLGLDPSQESMRSFGNTAAAMGKDLNQMIEAVADASTMEFERLKEFGIKARQEKDTVSFTFQGVTTTVRKNAEEITGYLKDIGDEKFGTAMASQAASFAGAISNLGDTFDNLFREAGAGGAAETMSESIRSITESLGTPEAIAGAEALAEAMASIVAAAAGGAADVITLIGKLKEFKVAGAPSEKGGTTAEGFFRRIFGAPSIEEQMQAAIETGDIIRRPQNIPISPEQSAVNESIIDQIVAETTGAGAIIEEPAAEVGADSKVVENKKAEIDAQKTLEQEFNEWKEGQKVTELEKMQEHYLLLKDLQDTSFEDLIAGRKDASNVIAALLEGDVKLTELTEKQKNKILVSSGMQALSFFAGNSKKMFKLQKAVGIANAIVSTSRGVTKALELPFPYNLAAAATVAAKGAAQIQQIKSTEIGGGSRTASGGDAGGATTGASAAAQSPVQEAANDEIRQAPQAINVTVDGSIDPTGARRIIEAINEATDDGLEINALVGS